MSQEVTQPIGDDRRLTETRTIDYIPSRERHGTARSLFAVWFVPNISLTVIVVGVIIGTLGMSLPWALLSVVVGTCVSIIFVASHSAQGPSMGVPQMVQTRAQFGIIGAAVPLAVALFIQLGYFAVLAYLLGELLSELTGLPFTLMAIVGAAVVLVITIVGYDLVHRYASVVSWLTVAVFAFLSFKVFTIDTPAVTAPDNSFSTFFLGVSLAASSGLVWAPFVADYSRYLPESTSRRAAFWYTYLGCVTGLVLATTVGVVITIQSATAASDPLTYLADLSGSNVAWLVLIVLSLGIIQANVLDLYSASMSAVTLMDAFGKFRSGSALKIRWAVATVACAVMTSTAIIGSDDFLTAFENLLFFTFYAIIPWTAINLVDFYWMRRGEYSTPDLYHRNGIYGAVNWMAIGIYFFSVAVQVPFMYTPLYTGPLVEVLGGADITWIVGLVAAGLPYYVIRRNVEA